MKIAVCLKEVPSRETRYEVDSEIPWIKEDNVSFEASECDEYALEEGLRLKEKFGGEVLIVSIGTSRTEKVIRKALAMGADRAILIIDDDAQLLSPFAKASALSKVLHSESVDLTLTGTQSDDYGYAQTGIILAELLQIPHISLVMEVEVNTVERKLRALREMESGWFQWIETTLPALLTVQAGISAIRYPSLKGIMQARKKEIRSVRVNELELDLESYPRLEILDLYLPQSEKKAQLLEGTTEQVVETLLHKLQKEEKVL